MKIFILLEFKIIKKYYYKFDAFRRLEKLWVGQSSIKNSWSTLECDTRSLSILAFAYTIKLPLDNIMDSYFTIFLISFIALCCIYTSR